MRWRLSAAAGEGLRSAWFGRGTTTALFVLTVWAVALPAALDALAVQQLVHAEQRRVAAGGRVLVASNQGAGGIDRRRCEALGAVKGVVAAGSVSRFAESVRITAAPDDNVGLFAVSPGIWSLLGPAGPGDSLSDAGEVAVAPSRAERWGLMTGSYVALLPSSESAPDTGTPYPPTLGAADIPTRPMRVVVVESQVLGEEDSGILVRVAPIGTAEQCFVAADPSRYVALRGALPGLLAQGTQAAMVTDRLVTGQFTEDYSARYAERATRWGYLIAGALLGTIWLFVRWVHRGADALYLTLGAGRAERAIVRSTEWGVIAFVAGAAGCALAVLLGVAVGVDSGRIIATAVRQAAATLFVAAAFVALGLLLKPSSVLSALRDR